jgi:hypothetical protein
LVSAIQISWRARLAFACRLLGRLVEDVGGLVHPAALLAHRRPHLAERLPEAERTVGDGELRRNRKPAAPEIEQQPAP